VVVVVVERKGRESFASFPSHSASLLPTHLWAAVTFLFTAEYCQVPVRDGPVVLPRNARRPPYAEAVF
jgi:hypothetical protein